MAHKPDHPMPIEERAKQFMPFAALSGLPEALALKEQEILMEQGILKEEDILYT